MRGARWSTDALNPYQLAFVACHLPQPSARTGRPAYTNLELLPGILRVLRSGCRWRDLDEPGHPSGVTHWRRLRYWRRGQHFKALWKRLLDICVQGKWLDLSVLSIDGTLIPSPEFKERTGYSGKHRLVGTKLSVVVDARGTPLSVSLAPGNAHDGALGYLTMKNIYRVPRVLRSVAAAVSRGRDGAAGRPRLRLADVSSLRPEAWLRPGRPQAPRHPRRAGRGVALRARPAPLPAALGGGADAQLAEELPPAALSGGPHERLLRGLPLPRRHRHLRPLRRRLAAQPPRRAADETGRDATLPTRSGF